ncbi:MAG: hypothetical protein FWD49_00585 [Firmicutes bacterium]|nr:hypothetical protein [Bacillota bacterium]
MRKFLIFLLGIVVGITLVIGGVAFAGYIILTRYSVGDVEDLLGMKGTFTEEERKLSALGVALGILEAFGGIDKMTIEEFEETAGVKILSRMIADTIKIDANDFVKGTFAELPNNIINAFTVGALFDFIGFVDSEIPLFSDPVFLDQKVLHAFEDIHDFALDRFISVVYDCEIEDCTHDNEDCELGGRTPSVAVMQVFGKKTLSELANADDLLDDLMLKQVIDIKPYPESPLILNALADSKIANLSSDISNLLVSEVFDTDASDTHIIISKLKNKKVLEIDKELEGVLASTTIGELLNVDKDDLTKEPILRALSGTFLTADALNDAVSGFTVADIFDDTDTGLIGLIPSNTRLKDLPNAITSAATDASLYKLNKLGIYNTAVTDPERKAVVFNLNPSEVIDQAASGNPNAFVHLTYHYTVSADFDLTPALVNSLLGSTYSTIRFVSSGSPITITIPEDSQFTRVFNLDLNGNNLIIEDNVSVLLPHNLETGYMYINGTTRTGAFVVPNCLCPDCVAEFGEDGKPETFKISSTETAPNVEVDYTNVTITHVPSIP